ncbi:DUF4145 domain-containing protein [Burkholderia gladioli]|uniref:DUF4145 domain-containing protein n=1 Tax=Burkholderia gladioli TaxID=28095 RepID=UPI00163FBE79|nr:DUF4145 domain-containing protein [Burkholderia gladioli]
MATFALKCPHCLRDHTSFTVIATQLHKARVNGWNEVETFACCNACKKGVSGTVLIDYPSVNTELEKTNLSIDTISKIEIGGWFPKPPTPDVPDHLPESVGKAFAEAERLKIAGFRGPAGNAYRRALEAGLKHVDQELKGTLFARIEKLASDGRITIAMKDFAHRIRTLGNEASHETPEIGEDEIDDLAVFSRLFLMYQFTLPGMLNDAKPE